MALTALLLNLIATWTMFGIAWFVQVVHYPMLKSTEGRQGADFFVLHQRLTSLVVITPMLVETITAVLLVFVRPATVSAGWAILGACLILVIWLSTFGLQIPQHRKLSSGYDALTCDRLINTSWVRTLSWSARGLVTLWMMVKVL